VLDLLERLVDLLSLAGADVLHVHAGDVRSGAAEAEPESDLIDVFLAGVTRDALKGVEVGLRADVVGFDEFRAPRSMSSGDCVPLDELLAATVTSDNAATRVRIPRR
jgi:hypothetical protein